MEAEAFIQGNRFQKVAFRFIEKIKLFSHILYILWLEVIVRDISFYLFFGISRNRLLISKIGAHFLRVTAILIKRFVYWIWIFMGRYFFQLFITALLLLTNYFWEKGGSLDVVRLNGVNRSIATNFLAAFVAAKRLVLKIRQERASHMWSKLLIKISEISIMKNWKRSVFGIRNDGWEYILSIWLRWNQPFKYCIHILLEFYNFLYVILIWKL